MPGYSDARDWMSQIGAMGIMGGQQQSLLWQMLSMMSQLGPAMGAGQGPTSFAARAMGPSLMGGVFGSPTTPGIGGAIAGMMAQGQAQTAAGWAFPDILGAGGGLAGRGLGPAAAGGMAQFMGGLAGGGTSMADISQITAAAGTSGAFRGITDVKEARAKLQEMVKTVTALSKELSATIEDVSTGMAQVRSMGYTGTAGQAGALRGLLSGSAASGMPLNQFAQFQAAMGQEGRLAMGIPLAAASGAAGRSMAHIGMSLRSGSLSDEVLMNATGQGGQAGVVALASQIQGVSAQQLNRAQNQYALAAFVDPATGKLKQDLVNQFMQGAMDPGQVMQMAQRNIGRVGGQAAWMGMQPQLMGQFQEMTGNMGGMGFASMLMQRHGYDMDPTNPRNVAAFTRAIGLNPRDRGDIMRGQAYMEVQSRWGENQELITASDRARERETGVAKSISDRMASASISGFVNRSVNKHLEAVAGPAERALQAVVDSGQALLMQGSYQATSVGVADYRRLSSAIGDVSAVTGGGDISSMTTAARQRYNELRSALGSAGTAAERAHIQSALDTAGAGLGQMTGAAAIQRRGGAQYLTEEQRSIINQFYALPQEEQRKISESGMRGDKKDILGILAGGADVDAYARQMVEAGDKAAGNIPTGGVAGLMSFKKDQAARSVAYARSVREQLGLLKTQKGVVDPDAAAAGVPSSSALMAAAVGSGAKIFGSGAAAEGVVGALMAAPEREIELLGYLKGRKGEGTIAEIGAALKWSPDIQKAIFGDAATSGAKIAYETLNDVVTKSGAASTARTREDLLQTGWLSEDSATAYGVAGRGKSRAARRFAGRMTAAHGLLEAGRDEAGLGAATGAIVDITSLRGREFREAMGTLSGAGITTTNELRELQRARESGGRITEGEMEKAFGGDWMKQMGLTQQEIAGGKIYSKGTQEKMTSYWAGQITPAGSATDAGRKAPIADQLASTLAALNETMKTGITLKIPEGGLPVALPAGATPTVPTTPQEGVHP